MTETEDIFLHTKPVKIITQLNNPTKDNYASQIARDIDCTYSHAVRIVQKLDEKGLVNTEREGRKKILKLTESGEEIAETLSELLHHFRQMD